MITEDRYQEIMSQRWLTSQDIKELVNGSKKYTEKIIKAVREDMKKDNKLIFKGFYPKDRVLKML